MGEAYRGLTIRFAADGTKVMSTLKTMSRAANNVESELRLVQRALKFDSTSETAAAERMQLLAEKAATTGAKVEKMRRQMAELGKVEFGGVKMEKLSQSTKDASTQAALMQARYNDATAAIAKLHNELKETWWASKQLGDAPNPFLSEWKNMPVETIQRFVRVMQNAGTISREEAVRMSSAVAKLRKEFRLSETELKKFNSIAEYQSFGRKMQEEAAKAKAAAQQFAAAAKEMRATEFTPGLKEARAEIDRLAAQARVLKEALRADPGSFTAYAQSVETMRAKMKAITTESEKLRAEMASLGSQSGVERAAADMVKLASDVSVARAEVDRLAPEFIEAQTRVESLTEHVNELRTKMLAAGNTKLGAELDAQFRSANAELTEAKAKLESLSPSMKKAEERAQMLNKALRLNEAKASLAANNAELAKMEARLTSVQKTALISSSAFTSMGMQMYSTIYPAVMMGGMYALNAARDIDAAYRDMRKTVQGTEEDFEHLKEAAIEFGDTHFTSADTMLEIESYGGQLGIAVENLEQFGKVVSDLDIATNDLFQTEDIALWLGKMANIMHLNVEEYDNFADSLVRLGNSEPALESDIAAITSRFAGMATLVGSTPDEILAIATAATATGQKAEAAGGSLQRTFGRIESAVAGVSDGMRNLDDMTEEDIEAFEGATDKLQAYADIAGMTAEQFATLWESDATTAFQKFVEGLKRIDDEGGSVDKTLQDLGITGVRDKQLLEGLTNTTDVLRDSLYMSKNAFRGVGDEYGAAGDAAREADNKSQGFSGTLQIMYNNAQHLAMMLGDSFVPVLQIVTGLLKGLVDWFGQLNPTMQTILTTGIALSAALGPMLTGIGAFGNMTRSFKTSLEKAATAEQTMMRVNNSMMPGMAALGRSYQKNAKIVDAYKTATVSSEKAQQYMSKAQKNMAAASRTAGANMAVMSAQAAVANETYGALSTSMETAEKRMQRASKATLALKSVGSFLKGVGGAAAFAAAFVAIDRAVAAVSDMVEKVQTYEKSVEGVRKSAERLREVNDNVEGRIKSLSTTAQKSTGDWQKYKDALWESTQQSAAFADRLDQQLDAYEENAAYAQYWADKILEIQSTYDGSRSSLEQLKTAVNEYNSATGSSISIVDEMTGRLSVNTDELNKNTDAFKKNAYAKAVGEVGADAMKEVARLDVEMAQNTSKLTTLYGEQAEVVERMGGDWEAYNSSTDQAIIAQRSEIQMLEQSNGELSKQRDAAKETADAAYELAESSQKEADAATAEANACKEAARAVETYVNALGGNEEALKSAAAAAGYAEDDLASFTAALYEAGISAEVLGNVGADAFVQLYQSANGNLEATKNALNLVNDFGIDPKHITITDDGTIKLKTDELTGLELKQLTEKGFVVTDNGTIEKTENELEMLDKMQANPSVYVSGGALGVLSSIMNYMNWIDGMKASVSVFAEKIGFATGGISSNVISQIPMHADGGINGIVTRATLTNAGWVGENGAEAVFQMGGSSAIIPLTNRRYVRPFARAVAGEMGGGQRQVVNNYNITLDYKAGDDANKIVRDLNRAVRAQNLMGGRR